MKLLTSVSDLGRLGAATATSLALAGMVACSQAPANTASNTAAAANVASGLGAFGPAPSAAATPGGLAPGGLAPAAPGATPAPGMAGPGMAGSGTPSAMGYGGAPAVPQDAAANAQWDGNTYAQCVPSAVRSGASPAGAQRYCSCVVAQLDQYPLQQKQTLTLQSPQIQSAVTNCRPTAAG